MGIVAGVAVAAVVWCYVTWNPVQRVGEKFVAAVQSRNFDEAYGLLHPDLQTRLPQAQFNEMLHRTRLHDMQNIQWGDWLVGVDGRSEVLYGAATMNGQPVEINMVIQMYNGKRKLYNFQFQGAQG